MIFKNLNKINCNTLINRNDNLIILLYKNFIISKIEKITKQESKPHQLKKNKNKIAYLLTLKNKNTYIN